MKKSVTIVVTAVIIILVLFLFFQQKNKPENLDHIFLITIDTLRADHMGSYGYPRNTTPFLDSIASKGVLFENAISQSASTCPSHSSIFTGLYPSQHLVLANGFILDDSFVTLPEILRKRGYTTVAFTSTDRHFLASNIDQGFDTYVEPEDTKKSYDLSYMKGEYTVNKAIKWLQNFDKNKKVFMWIHLFDPHLPRKMSKKKIRRYYSDKERKGFRRYLNGYLKRSDNNIFKKFIRVDKFITKYDSEIRYVDEQINSLFQFAERSGLNDRALWVITADHGEGLGQHDWIEHGMELYREAVHVPLIFYYPRSERGFKVPNVVENFDIFPTILELTGTFKKKYGGMKIPARSLKKVLLTGIGEELNSGAFTERQLLRQDTPDNEIAPAFKKFYKEGEKYSLQIGNYRYIYRSKGKDELFNIDKDPFELTDLLNKEEKIKDGVNLKKKLLKIIFMIKRESGKNAKITNKKIIERLKSLGYVF